MVSDLLVDTPTTGRQNTDGFFFFEIVRGLRNFNDKLIKFVRNLLFNRLGDLHELVRVGLVLVRRVLLLLFACY